MYINSVSVPIIASCNGSPIIASCLETMHKTNDVILSMLSDISRLCASIRMLNEGLCPFGRRATTVLRNLAQSESCGFLST